MELSIHAGHRARLRERYQNYGLDALAEHEILEMFLFYTIPRCNTNELAHRLLDQFGSLRNLFRTDIPQLCTIHGVSTQTALHFRFVADLQNHLEKIKKQLPESFDTQGDAVQYVRPFYQGKTLEMPSVLLLDETFAPIQFLFLKEGTFANCTVMIDEVAKALFSFNASSFLLFHNHPSGTAMPSEEDILCTRKFCAAFAPFNRPLLEHYILSSKGFYPIISKKIPEYATSYVFKTTKSSQS